MQQPAPAKQPWPYFIAMALTPGLFFSALLVAACLMHSARRPEWIDWACLAAALLPIPIMPFFAPRGHRSTAFIFALALLITYPFILAYLALVIVCVVTGDCL